MTTKKSRQHAFTLVELLLYIGIASSILFASTFFLGMLLESGVKNETVAEVEQQGLEIMELLTQTIRNADVIVAPAEGASTASLSLNTYTAGLNPTVFDLSGGAIHIQEGSGSPVTLTNSRVTASSLNFQNLSRSGTPGVVRISFSLSSVNPSGRSEYNFSKIFYASAALRQP